MSAPSPPRPTFPVSLPGVGDFTFRRRTIGDDIKIMVAYDRITGGLEQVSSYLDRHASALATYQVLAATWPSPEWAPARIAEMDALADERLTQLLVLFGAVSAREDEFRPAAQRRFKAAGEGAEPQLGGVVPPQIQPSAN